MGIVLVIQHQATIAIIGVPSSTVLEVFLVFLAMGSGGNLCSHIGAFVDLITGEKTLFDGCVWVYQWWKGRKEGQVDV